MKLAMVAKRMTLARHSKHSAALLAEHMTIDRHRAFTVFLLVIGVLTRIPFRSHFLFNVDSVNYALALDSFDLAAHQPHPPGYLLYVVMAKIAAVLVGDVPTALVVLSVLFSGLTLAALFQLGFRMFDTATGLAAALLLLASPLFWFYGEVALPHVPDAFLTTATALVLYRAWKEDESILPLAAFVLSAAGGLRPQSLVFLLPLYLLVGLSTGRRTFLISLLVLGVASLAWLVALFALSGGAGAYVRLIMEFMSQYQQPTSFLFGGATAVARNFNLYARYLAYGLNLGIIPIALHMWMYRSDLRSWVPSSQSVFLAAWVVPVTLVYVLVHIGQPGLSLVLLPAMTLVAARCLTRIFTTTSIDPGLLAPSLALLIALESAQFLFLPDSLLGKQPVALLNRSTIRSCDAHYAELLEDITYRFSPSHTVLVSRDWRHLEYYLPSFRVERARLWSDKDTQTVTINSGSVARSGVMDIAFIGVAPLDLGATSPYSVDYLTSGILHTQVPATPTLVYQVEAIGHRRPWSCSLGD